MRSIAVFTILTIILVGCSSDRPAETISEEKSQLSASTPHIVIDVRTAGEFASGHIEGAINIPHGEIGQRIAEVTKDKDQPIVVYCRTGHRSGIALNTLEALGYTHVENAGGYEAYKKKLGP